MTMPKTTYGQAIRPARIMDAQIGYCGWIWTGAGDTLIAHNNEGDVPGEFRREHAGAIRKTLDVQLRAPRERAAQERAAYERGRRINGYC